ncbi:MAG: hypothetical protein ABS38_11540 [Acidovorax sp. SCN 68-22]|nr:MAG: hypothetical protein ABS38_11540 [Acidovorax sp. SCN 68-22]
MTSTVAGAHAVMTKDEVRAAIGWVGVIILSPIVGPLLYAIAGVNRIRRASILAQRPGHGMAAADFHVEDEVVGTHFGRRFLALKTLGDRVARHPLTTGNRIETLETGDAAYAAMLAAIAAAERSIILESYIFDRDPLGLRIADALIEAYRRGVAVRVLIDAVGARYSVPSIAGHLREGGVAVDVFNGNIIVGLRLPYANLRTHRKIIVVDGTVGFMGGMNIREGFTREFAGDAFAHDTHFRIEGPVVADLFAVAAEDWCFATGEALAGPAWEIPALARGGMPVLARAVPTGPDSYLETNHKLLIGALSVARHSVRIMSPYFLPDQELISALSEFENFAGFQGVCAFTSASSNMAAEGSTVVAAEYPATTWVFLSWRAPIHILFTAIRFGPAGPGIMIVPIASKWCASYATSSKGCRARGKLLWPEPILVRFAALSPYHTPIFEGLDSR